MVNNKKFKILPILIGIFILVAVLRGFFWYLVEYENCKYQTKSGVFKQEKKQLDYPKKLPEIKKSNLKEGHFTLSINRYLNKSTTVQYIIPLDKFGNPGPQASNIVFYAPYNGDAKTIQKGLKPWLRYFAEELGYTVFSLTIKANTDITNDHNKYYIYQEAGWFELIFEIKARIEREFKLKSKPLLIVGESSGGSMAQQMAAAYPEKIDAAAWNGGARYVPVIKKSKVAWLALNTWGCYGIPATRQFKRQAESMKQQVLNSQAPPIWNMDKLYHHGASNITYKLIHSFIKGVVELRNSHSGILPEFNFWPVSEVCFNKRQYYPSKKFATLWKQLPHSVAELLVYDTCLDKEFAVFNYTNNATRIVIYMDDLSYNNSILAMDNLYFLSREKAIPIALKFSGNCLNDFEHLKKSLQIIIKDKKWKTLPIYAFGIGVGGQLLASACLNNGSKRIVRITTFNSNYDSPFNEISISTYRKNSNIMLKMYFEESINHPENNKFNTEIISIPQSELIGKKWFSFFEKATR